MGGEYPGGSDFFRRKLQNAFRKKAGLTDPGEIERALQHGEFVKRELEALYYLRKYRALKKMYYQPDEENDSLRRFEEQVGKGAHTK